MQEIKASHTKFIKVNFHLLHLSIIKTSDRLSEMEIFVTTVVVTLFIIENLTLFKVGRTGMRMIQP
jgi:hypothetical protein